MSAVKIGNRVRYQDAVYIVLDRAPTVLKRPEMYGAPVSQEYLRVTRNAARDFPIPRGSGNCWWLQDVADPHRFVRARETEILPDDDTAVIRSRIGGGARAILHTSADGTWVVHKPFGHLPTTVYTVSHAATSRRLTYFRGLKAAKSAADALPALPDTSDRAAAQSVVDLAKSLPGYYRS